jgi:hypothetical protein
MVVGSVTAECSRLAAKPRAGKRRGDNTLAYGAKELNIAPTINKKSRLQGVFFIDH